jgi:hypothetical protein
MEFVFVLFLFTKAYRLYVSEATELVKSDNCNISFEV